MKNLTGYKFWVMIFFIGVCAVSYADKISSPPPSKDIPKEILLYLQELYGNFHNLEEVTTNPSGNRTGEQNDMLIYNASSTRYVCFNIDGSKLWSGIQIQSLP